MAVTAHVSATARGFLPPLLTRNQVAKCTYISSRTAVCCRGWHRATREHEAENSLTPYSYHLTLLGIFSFLPRIQESFLVVEKDGEHRQTLGARPQTALPVFRNKKRTSPSHRETRLQVGVWISSGRG